MRQNKHSDLEVHCFSLAQEAGRCNRTHALATGALPGRSCLVQLARVDGSKVGGVERLKEGVDHGPGGVLQELAAGCGSASKGGTCWSAGSSSLPPGGERQAHMCTCTLTRHVMRLSVMARVVSHLDVVHGGEAVGVAVVAAQRQKGWRAGGCQLTGCNWPGNIVGKHNCTGSQHPAPAPPHPSNSQVHRFAASRLTSALCWLLKVRPPFGASRPS